MSLPARRAAAYAFLAIVLAAVLYVTCFPDYGADHGTFRFCLVCGDFGTADFILNVILFVPLGIALRWVGVPVRWTIVALAALSLGIEIAQLWIPGRESTLSDVLSNTTGGAVGALLWWWVPRRHRWGPGLIVAGIAGLAVIAATPWLLRPVYPRTIWYGQWTPDLGSFETYGGKVSSADIAGLPLHSWRLDNTDAVRQRLESGAPLRVRLTAGAVTSRLAPLFNLMDDQRRLILLLGADRGDLVLRVTTRATDVRLQEPEFRWRGALAAVRPGDTLALTVWRPGTDYCLTLNGRTRCGFHFGPADGWRLLLYWPHLPAAIDALFDAAWLIAMLAPAVLALVVLLARHIPTRKTGLRAELP